MRANRPFGIPYRWELMVWLWLAFFFNQADRQVFSVVLPRLQADLGLNDVQAGLVASTFTVVLGLLAPFAGYAGDVFSRARIITIAVLGWSVATMLTGFSTGLVYLVVIRSLATGVGEALYAPSSNAIISQHHVQTRALAMAIHQTSLYTGVVLSGGLAGYLADRFGWRASFQVFGVGGILLAGLLAWRLHDGAPVAGHNLPAPRVWLRSLLGRPTVLLLGLGFACMVFVNIGYLTWTPTYLYERFGLSLANAGFSSMFYHHLGALVGVLLGGRLSDRLARRRPLVRPQLQAFALLLGAPLIYLVGHGGSFAVVCGALAGFGFFRGIYDSNIYAALYEVIEPRLHASASAVIIAFAFVAGAVAPVALGYAKHTVGLASGIGGLAVFYLVASASVFVAASWCFEKDRKEITSYVGASCDRTT